MSVRSKDDDRTRLADRARVCRSIKVTSTILVLALLLAAMAAAEEGPLPRRGLFASGLSLTGGIPLAEPRRRTDYLLLRQLDYYTREDVTVGVGIGFGGAGDAWPQTALQLQSVWYVGAQPLLPYLGAHAGLLADFFKLRVSGTMGLSGGVRWDLNSRWSLFVEAKPSATFPRWRDSFFGISCGFSLLADSNAT